MTPPTAAPATIDADVVDVVDVQRHLEEERARLLEERTELVKPLLERCPADLVDLAEAARERERRADRVEAIDHRLETIDAAEQRLHDGTYGTCVTCGQAIEAERLAVIPTTDTCVQHTSRRRRH